MSSSDNPYAGVTILGIRPDGTFVQILLTDLIGHQPPPSPPPPAAPLMPPIRNRTLRGDVLAALAEAIVPVKGPTLAVRCGLREVTVYFRQVMGQLGRDGLVERVEAEGYWLKSRPHPAAA